MAKTVNIDCIPICASVFKMESAYYLRVSENMAIPLGSREPVIILPSWPVERVRDWRSK